MPEPPPVTSTTREDAGVGTFLLAGRSVHVATRIADRERLGTGQIRVGDKIRQVHARWGSTLGREGDDQTDGQPDERAPGGDDGRARHLVEGAIDRPTGDGDADQSREEDQEPALGPGKTTNGPHRHEQVHDDQRKPAEGRTPGKERKVVRSLGKGEQARRELIEDDRHAHCPHHEENGTDGRVVSLGHLGQRRGNPAVTGHGEDPSRRRDRATDPDRHHVKQNDQLQQSVDPGPPVPTGRRGGTEGEQRGTGGGRDGLQAVVETRDLDVGGEQIPRRGDARRGQNGDGHVTLGLGRLFSQIAAVSNPVNINTP